MKERRKKLKFRLTPPGYNVDHEVGVLIAWTVGAIVFALFWFMISMSRHYSDLFRTVNGEKIMKPECIFTYTEMMGWAMILYLMPIVLSLVNIGNRYLYLKTDSMSIYTMKRLSSAKELPIRCLAMPLICIAQTLFLAAVTILITWLLYLLILPKEAIPEDAGRILMSQIWHWWSFH